MKTTRGLWNQKITPVSWRVLRRSLIERRRRLLVCLVLFFFFLSFLLSISHSDSLLHFTFTYPPSISIPISDGHKSFFSPWVLVFHLLSSFSPSFLQRRKRLLTLPKSPHKIHQRLCPLRPRARNRNRILLPP